MYGTRDPGSICKPKFEPLNFSGEPHIYENGVWDCMGETIAQTHVRAHRAGVKISDIKGYKNLGGFK